MLQHASDNAASARKQRPFASLNKTLCWHALQQVSFEVSRSHGVELTPPPLPTRPSGGASRTAPGAKERDPQRGWPGYASFDDLGDASFREAAAPETSGLWSRQGQARPPGHARLQHMSMVMP